jgi:S1-C subfamily serine protease
MGSKILGLSAKAVMALFVLMVQIDESDAELRMHHQLSEIQGWKIGLSETLRGCLASATYDDKTTVWIGFDGTENQAPPYIALTNPDWKFVDPKKVYDLTFRTDQSRNWRGTFSGFVISGHGGLVLQNVNVNFLTSFAAARGMAILLGSRTLTKPNLSGSSAALEAVIECQKRFNDVAREATKKDQAENGGTGTGFYITNDRVLTNAHVVKGCSAVRILQRDSQEHFGRVVARDEQNDLALIGAVSANHDVPPLRKGVLLGESIFVYGFPLSGVLASSGNFTVGHVSALTGLGDDSRSIQISAPVQPGNSGGPVLDRYGNAVGVVVSGYRPPDGSAQNINFAIRASAVESFLESNGVRQAKSEYKKALESQEVAQKASRFTLKIVCEPKLSAEIEATLFNRASELDSCKRKSGPKP